MRLYAPLGGSVEQAATLHFAVCDAPLPAAVKSFEATLEGFENGVLTVTVPKSSDEQGKKRKIVINRK